MSVKAIRDAIASAFIAGAFFDADKINWENTAFNPPASTPWAKFDFVPGQPFVYTLGSNGKDQVDGFAQIQLNYPLNAGSKPALDKATAICSHASFKAGSKLTNSGQVVVIKTAGHNQGRVMTDYYRVDITINFYGHIQR